MNIIEGKLIAEGQKIAIVAGRFNEIITNKEGIAILDGHYQCHEMIGIQQQEEIVKPNE